MKGRKNRVVECLASFIIESERNSRCDAIHQVHGHHPSPGFTLVELLVVITIIGILIALLLPAVQAAREASRKLQCNNQLKQWRLACSQHEQANGFLPSGGWCYVWAGDPDRGFNRRQPGGWIYNILPYMEQEPLHDLGKGMTLANKKNQLAITAQSPLQILICPSRRQAIVYPMNPVYSQVNITPVSSTARTDYAANAGTPSGFYYFDPGGSDPAVVDAPGYNWTAVLKNTNIYDGVIFNISCLKMTQIEDGVSNTYLLGEKYLNPFHYVDGVTDTDNNPVYAGFDWDWQRCASYNSNQNRWNTPYQDTPGVDDFLAFGSAHAIGLNMAFCDGSVQSISYSIDSETNRCLCNRRDGKSIDANKF